MKSVPYAARATSSHTPPFASCHATRRIAPTPHFRATLSDGRLRHLRFSTAVLGYTTHPAFWRTALAGTPAHRHVAPDQLAARPSSEDSLGGTYPQLSAGISAWLRRPLGARPPSRVGRNPVSRARRSGFRRMFHVEHRGLSRPAGVSAPPGRRIAQVVHIRGRPYGIISVAAYWGALPCCGGDAMHTPMWRLPTRLPSAWYTPASLQPRHGPMLPPW